MQRRPHPSNFDRATIFQSGCRNATPTSVRMRERQFFDYVAQEVPDVVQVHPVLARDVIHDCYASISVFDMDRMQAYEDARAFAISRIQGRIARVHALESARQSTAPAHRNAPMASMTDRRGGADYATDDDRLD